MSTSSIPSTTQAWRYPADQSAWNGYHSLALRDVPVPQPGKGEVLVKLRAVSLNQRWEICHRIHVCTDSSSRYVEYQVTRPRLTTVQDIMIGKGGYPVKVTNGSDGQGFIPTSDGAGDVVAVGQDVTEWKVGDRIYSLVSEGWLDGPLKPEYFATLLGGGVQGCLSRYRIFPADFILPIPAHLSYEQAAAIPCAGTTAWNALFEIPRINKDSTVLVLGSGGVSIFAAHIVKAIGARVIATTSSQEKAEKYRAIGVDDIINYREFPDWSAKVKELTGGQGVDDVIEIGGQGTLVQSIKSIKQQGYVHLVGFLAQSESGQASTLSEAAQMIVFTQANLRGVAVGHKTSAQTFHSFVEKHKLEPVVDPKVFGWNKAVEAHSYMESGSHFGKVVIRVE